MIADALFLALIEDDVGNDAVKPGGKVGVAAKVADGVEDADVVL
jgi:hypothetical protein